MTLEQHVGIFFITPKGIILHICHVEKGEHYGDFINFPYSHDAVWQQHYTKQFDGKAFDYFPRGRIIFHKPSSTYCIYHDDCTDRIVPFLQSYYSESNVICALDEHYQCRWCNPFYFDESFLQTQYEQFPDPYNTENSEKEKEIASFPLIFKNLVFIT